MNARAAAWLATARMLARSGKGCARLKAALTFGFNLNLFISQVHNPPGEAIVSRISLPATHNPIGIVASARFSGH